MSQEKKDAVGSDKKKELAKSPGGTLQTITGLLSSGKDALIDGLSKGMDGAVEYMSMQNELIHAQQVLTVMMSSGDGAVPTYIIQKAKGFAFMTEVKAGLVVTAQVGSGIVIGKTEDGWSGPSCFTFGGGGLGFQAGATKTNIVLILNTDQAVQAFATRGQITVGADLQVAAGPIGREVSGQVIGSTGSIAPVYSYSHSKGIFAGMAMDGTVIVTRGGENDRFYGRAVTAGNILNGKEDVPDSEEYTQLIATMVESLTVEEKEDEKKDDEKDTIGIKNQIQSWVMSINKQLIDLTTMESELKRAHIALQNIASSKIAPYILRNAKGFALMVEIKAGLIFSGKGGVGLVIKKLGGGQWSGPSCFWFGGLAAGLSGGGSKTELVLILNTDNAVNAFGSNNQVKLGVDMEVTAGPIGKQVGGKIDIGSVAPCYSYSNTSGLYAGFDVSGMILSTRWDENERFYNSQDKVTPQLILDGKILPPENEDLSRIQTILARLCG